MMQTQRPASGRSSKPMVARPTAVRFTAYSCTRHIHVRPVEEIPKAETCCEIRSPRNGKYINLTVSNEIP